ncbi:hypothetical protein METBIDRAFT_76388 [Metschnikowia bicuspidata var. bicuspidata NRRL YB-4993]|uniref:tRNA/rRNA methyltransferase SpoU type domain-containing protein n=1 Tax=Metschnikowia bicuspidata var. bicuspidata NRRL YB-4993 TaxID=869754 RepID=A0A1A0HHN6_9ASCO|nr:hypothetical protein METBIDRAFT_76388 [Metschnikowia bicuspidata var. bicuspidata NRRL YB-4993]OBA23358.1 hypothetical protein METBIDRAFT_76388 [Metschnikowia bicuspidata var. bicuspidata NRRL YB-4993]
MISSRALIGKYFSEEQKISLASSLAENLLECPQDLPVLAELISHLSSNVLNTIYPKILAFVLSAINSNDKVLFEYAYELLKLSPTLFEDAWDAILSMLRSNMGNSNNFVPNFQVNIERFQNGHSLAENGLYASEEIERKNNLVGLFGFLSKIYTSNTFAHFSDLVSGDQIICLCLGHRDETIATASSHLLRWRVDSIVRQCAESKSTTEFYFTLVFDLTSSAYFQENLISQEFYWKILQLNLVGNSHEIRKLCLSILQLSLKEINTSFSTSLMSWDANEEKEQLREWSRYTTLFEVLGIDTSLHQTQAAVNDIVGIISADSAIHASWGFCLLSTGFRASMDSVRKYSAEILFSIKPENLHLLKYGLSFLEDHFLPYLMLSRHFNVRSKGPSTTDIHCEYADKFSSFLCAVMKSLSTPEELSSVLSTIMTVLANSRDTFDAVKIYTCHGLVKGLQEKKVLQYGKHDILLLKLFDNFSEGELFKRAIQTLNLRLLLNFEFKDLFQLGTVLSKFVRLNRYELFMENILLFSKYLSECGGDIPDEQAVIFLSLAAISEHMNEEIWNVQISKCTSSVLGMLLETGDCCIDYGTLCLAYAKLKFFNKTIELLDFDANVVSSLSILSLHKKLFMNTNVCLQKVSGFYKLKGNIYGEFHRLLSLYVERIGLKPDELAEILSVVTFETSHFTTILAIAKILKVSFTQGYADEDTKSASLLGLLSSVKELDADRFKLSEKELHILLIQVFFHENVLKSAVNNQILNDCVSDFADVIISNSYGRRGLMPAITKALSNFQIFHSDDFERLQFVPELIVKAMAHRELEVSAFKIEQVIGSLFDKEIALSLDSHIYASVYGVYEVAYKVWLLAILNTVRTSKCAEAILDVVFNKDDPYHFFKVLKPTDGAEEYVRMQLAKVVISVVDKVDLEEPLRQYFSLFIWFVENDPSPLVRVYFEWALAQQLQRRPELSEAIFEKLAHALTTHELKPILVTLYERVLFLMIQSMNRELETKYLTRLIEIIIPAASTNKAITRHFSMSMAISIYEEIHKKDLKVDSHLSVVIDNMHKSALATDAFGQFRSGDACLWNIVDDLNLVHISGGLLLRLYDREVDFIVQKDFCNYLSQSQLDALTHPVGNDKSDLWVTKLKENKNAKLSLQEASKGIASSLQTKSGAWSTVMDVDAKTQISDIKRSDLIVVASLVDKPPNLGGICRLCDVLGAGLLTLHDLAVKQNQQFKSVAVTADHWMPMTEVKPDGIVKYLREKKAEGYKLIGLEQTDQSVVLDNDLKFPAKSLILLGREKEGIPGELLAELDMCVEIKQVGVVRSMNIQTATAVIVHAYSTQNC